MMDIRIDYLTVPDVDAIRLLAEKIWPLAYGEILSQDQIRFMLDQRYRPEVLIEQIGGGDLFLGARVTEWLGYAHAYDLGQGVFKLDKLYMDVAHQGLGIGRQLLRRVLAEASMAGGHEMTLRVNRQNEAAIGFYKANGFKLSGRDRVAIGGGFFMDDYIMVRRLGE